MDEQVDFSNYEQEDPDHPDVVDHRQMAPWPRVLEGPTVPGVDSSDGGIHFGRVAWLEVLLAVEWDPQDTTGPRFSHPRIPDQEPLHSEAIAASVLVQLS